MKDDFLYQARPPVRKEFADRLFERLNGQFPEADPPPIARFPKVGLLGQPRLAWMAALLAALVLTAVTFASSGPAQAQALAWVRWIAGFAVEARQESPLKGLEGSPARPEPPDNPGATQSAQTPPGDLAPAIAATMPVYTVPVQTLPQALNTPPFAFGLPAWTPDGYVLDEQVAIANSQDWVLLTWRHPMGSGITLLVEREYDGYALPAGEASSREIQVNEQPALLIQGNWGAQHQWDPERGLTIYWTQAGRAYRLLYLEREPVHNEIRPMQADPQAITADLIRMAESIP